MEEEFMGRVTLLLALGEILSVTPGVLGSLPVGT